MRYNYIIIYNIIRAMDKKIEKDMGETKELVKHGRKCLRRKCWLGATGQCGLHGRRWMEECEFALEDRDFNVTRNEEEEMRAYRMLMQEKREKMEARRRELEVKRQEAKELYNEGKRIEREMRKKLLDQS